MKTQKDLIIFFGWETLTIEYKQPKKLLKN